MSKTKRTKKAAGSDNIESMLREDRVFKPSKEFSKQAHIGSMAQYKKLYKRSIAVSYTHLTLPTIYSV